MIRTRLSPHGLRMPAPSRLPGLEQTGAQAWAQGYWIGIAVGIAIGVCAGLVLARVGAL